MNTTVVKFDALADTVGTATQDDDFFPIGGHGLVFLFVCGVKIGSVRFKFRPACIHEFIDGSDFQFLSQLADIIFTGTGEKGQLLVGKPALLTEPEKIPVQSLEAFFQDFFFCFHNLFEIMEKPGIDLCMVIQFIEIHAPFECFVDFGNPFGAWLSEALFQVLLLKVGQDLLSVTAKTETPCFERTHGLLESLFEGSADRHGFTHRFHGCCQYIVRFRKFFEGPAGNFHYAVINCRFKGGAGYPGNIVAQFVQGITHGKFGCDLGNGKAGGLGGQGRTPGDSRIHLDDHQFSIGGIDGKLNIGAARFYPDFPDNGNSRVPHVLIFPVAEGLGRGNGDTVTGVDSHGINVFNGTDDDYIVVSVPHDLKLILLPAEQASFQHDLRCHG